jgi:flagellar hook-basal body complex protein FliE
MGEEMRIAAVARLAAGRTDGIREVYGAAQRAELIMQIRNKLEQACDEIRQMRF